MNGNNPYDRSRDRYQGRTSRQSEQFSDSDYGYGDEDRTYGQMGEGGGRAGQGQFDSESYGANRNGWAGDRDRGGYDRPRDSARGTSPYSEQSESYPARGYGPTRHSNSEGRGFGDRNISGSSQNYGSAGSSSDAYGAYGGSGYGAGTYGSDHYRRSSSGGGYTAGGAYGGSNRRSSAASDDQQHERGFFERAGDEVASWFGDEDAARRREEDHSGRGPANYTRSDQRILEDACDRLTDDRGVDATAIQVTVQDGEVTLDGTVPSRQQKRRAEDCVDGLSGVKHVQNNLRIQQSSDWNRNATSGQTSVNQSLSESSYDRTNDTSGTLA